MLTLSLSFFLFSSCVSRQQKHMASEQEEEWKRYSALFIENHLNRKVIYPADITSFLRDCDAKTSAKILVCVDLDCGACLMKFSFWTKFLSSLESEYGIYIPVIFYVTGNGELEKRVNKYWHYSWVYDSKGEFIEKNQLYDDRFQAILVDDQDNIKLIGNPMHNEKLAELYKRIIVSSFCQRESK